MGNKYYYSKKIQPNNYIEGAKMYEPFEIGVEADTFEEAEAEVQRLIRKKINELTPEPFKGDEYNQ